MILKNLRESFNSALISSLSVRKSLLVFATLLFSALMILFFSLLGLYLPMWLAFPLKVISLLAVIGLLFGLETFLILILHKEEEGGIFSYPKLLIEKGETVLKGMVLCLPMLALFTLFWAGISLFILLKAIPYLGTFFAVFLAFIPYLFSLGIVFLFVFALLVAFYVIPDLAASNQVRVKVVAKRVLSDPFTHLLCLFVPTSLGWMVWRLLMSAAHLTKIFIPFAPDSLENLFQSFFIFIPVALIFTPVTLFFTHFVSQGKELYVNKS